MDMFHLIVGIVQQIQESGGHETWLPLLEDVLKLIVDLFSKMCDTGAIL